MGLTLVFTESATLTASTPASAVVTITPANPPSSVDVTYFQPATVDLATGLPGPGATVTVGATTTLAAGSSATVNNVGTATNAVLDFGIPQGIQGIQGIQGPAGTAGTSATVTAGTTTTLSAGSSATVTNVGTSSAAVFNFGIPQGPAGPKGDTGDTGVVYATSPIMYDSGSQTISILTTPSFTSVTATDGTSGTVLGASGVTFTDLSLQTTAWLEAPINGTTYGRKNGAWSAVVSSVAWGSISGTLSSQTDLQTALNAKSPLASPTFTGDPKAPTPATGDNDTSIATTAFVKAQGYITSSAAASTYQTLAGMSSYLTTAAAASTYYPQTNPSGFVTSAALAGYALLNGTSNFQVTSGTIKSMASDDNFVQLNETRLEFGNGVTPSGLSVSGTGITFADSTVQTTAAVAGIPDAPSDSQTYGRNNGAWTVVSGGGSFNGGAVANPITIAGTTIDSEMSSDYFGVELSSDHSQFAELTYGSLTVSRTGVSTLVTPDGITFPDATSQTTAFPGFTGYATETYVNSQGFITSSALTPYLLSATAATTYAPIAAAVPTGGTTGQVLTKTSATNYALSWTTPAVGDKYYTTSTTSLSVSNGSKSLTVDTGLSYTTQQSVIVAYDATHHMHGTVTSYNSSTGAMVVDVAQHTGTGTYTAWTVNVGGISSVAEWGLITGTLSNQTDLQSALDAKLAVTTAASTYAPLASPSLTGTPTAPTATVGTNTTQIATTAFVLANASGGGVNIQTFSTAGTTSWTKPTGAKLVVGYMWGAGSGGGSGARNATSGIRSGGGGGAGGTFLKFIVDASVLSGSESVVIGAGGAGGASQTTNGTAGIASTSGGVTSFAGRFQCSAASNAAGGSLTATASGATTSGASLEGILNTTTGINTGGTGNTTTGSAATFTAMYYYHASGGGGGAGAAASSTTNRDGGAGGTKPVSTTAQSGLVTAIAGGAGGTSAGASPTTGTTGSLSTGGGTGGGGGAYRTGVAGMAGANGIWGSGGGGGAASDDGFASGKGGDGGSGALILVTYF